MRRTICMALVAIAACVHPAKTFARELYGTGVIYSLNKSDNTAVLAGNTYQAGDFPNGLLFVPDTIMDAGYGITYPIIQIAEYALSGREDLTSLSLCGNTKVTEIGKCAFRGCTRLKYVYIYQSQLKSIGDGAFYKCSRLACIAIPNTVTTIGELAFANCTSLRSVTIGNHVTSVGENAFWGCDNLEEIIYPAGLDLSNTALPPSVKMRPYSRSKTLYILDTSEIFEPISSNDQFDKTTNYQFHHVQNYVGETLYLVPLTGADLPVIDPLDANHKWEAYSNFMDFDKFDDDYGHAISLYLYKFDPFNDIDGRGAGTHKRHIEGHRFYVDKALQMGDDTYMWVLYLTDLNTGDKVKYIYDAELTNTYIDFDNFPFIVEKHYKYLKSLIGTKLVFGTKTHEHEMTDGAYMSFIKEYKADYKDINTGEQISFTTPYVKWTIKDVGLNIKESTLYFIVSDGRNTTKVKYNHQYSNHNRKYNAGNRVFTEKQWNELVSKYGEQHMALIMSGKVLDDMTEAEKYLTGGKRAAKGWDKPSETESAVKAIGNALIKSTKETVKDLKAIGKGLFGK